MSSEQNEPVELLEKISEQLDEILKWPATMRQMLSTIAWAAFGLGLVGIPLIMWLLE